MQVKIKKIKQWMKLHDELKEVKSEEMKLRKEIVAEIHEDSKMKGKKVIQILGYEIVATNKIKMDLDKEALDSLYDDLDEAAKKCLKNVPKLVNKEIKNLPDDNILWNVIEESPAAPSLTIVFDEDYDE